MPFAKAKQISGTAAKATKGFFVIVSDWYNCVIFTVLIQPPFIFFFLVCDLKHLLWKVQLYSLQLPQLTVDDMIMHCLETVSFNLSTQSNIVHDLLAAFYNLFFLSVDMNISICLFFSFFIIDVDLLPQNKVNPNWFWVVDCFFFFPVCHWNSYLILSYLLKTLQQLTYHVFDELFNFSLGSFFF